MRARLIETLAERDPTLVINSDRARYAPEEFEQQAAARFAARYANVSFGWTIAGNFASAKKGIPEPMVGRDAWVNRACLYRLNPRRYRDRHIEEAYQLALNPRIRQPGDTLRALLLSCPDDDADRHIRAVSDRSRVDPRTIEAFESLFYNVIDRRCDALALAQEIYPDTRLVEMYEDYTTKTPIKDMLLRAGYNRQDLDLTAYLAGIGDVAFLSRLASRSDRETELVKHFMGHALVMALTGFLSGKSVSMSRAVTLQAASRQGGQQAEESPLGDMSSYINEGLAEAIQTMRAQQRERAIRDAGQGPVVETTAEVMKV